jgi:sulfite exporter TauE/SafE
VILPLCLSDPAALDAAGGFGPLLLAMGAAGLATGATHCAGMCAPFVLAQGAARAGTSDGGVLARLSGAALAPYHLGRMLGYAMLGAMAGGASGLLSGGARWWLAVPLLIAALVMLREGCVRLGAYPHPNSPPLTRERERWRFTTKVSAILSRLTSPLMLSPTGWRGVALGLALSLLPCGAIYAALAGAAASGSALGGALCMAAFAAGTVPALVGIGLLGRVFARRFGPALRPAAAALFLLNGAVLGLMAARLGGFA